MTGVGCCWQWLGARSGFSLSGAALLLTALLGWRARSDRPAADPAPQHADPAARH